MSVNVQQLLSDARKLVTRLKEYDNNTDNLMAQTQALNKCVETMKEYHEEMTVLSGATPQPRSSIIVTIQRESKQLRKLENENRELKCALEDYQFVLELIMSKYRQQTSQLIKVEKAEMACAHIETDDYQQLVNKLTNQVCDMAAVIQKAIQIDDNSEFKEQQVLAQLKLENQHLRQLLNIARTIGNSSQLEINS